MTSKIAYTPSTDLVPHPSIEHDATDSGYGTSTVGGSSVDSENLFEKSLSSEVRCRRLLETTERQQEVYQDNCLLLAGSIEETKHILKVDLPCFGLFL